jgi:hypothetical protein
MEYDVCGKRRSGSKVRSRSLLELFNATFLGMAFYWGGYGGFEIELSGSRVLGIWAWIVWECEMIG